MIDGFLGHDQSLSDLGVAEAFGQACEHLEFACGEACRIVARLWTWTARQATDAALAESPSHDRGRRAGTQPV